MYEGQADPGGPISLTDALDYQDASRPFKCDLDLGIQRCLGPNLLLCTDDRIVTIIPVSLKSTEYTAWVRRLMWRPSKPFACKTFTPMHASTINLPVTQKHPNGCARGISDIRCLYWNMRFSYTLISDSASSELPFHRLVTYHSSSCNGWRPTLPESDRHWVLKHDRSPARQTPLALDSKPLMDYLFCCLRRCCSKSSRSSAPPNGDSERQPLLNSEPYAMRIHPDSEAETENPLPSRTFPTPSSNAGSGSGALEHPSSHLATVAPSTPGFIIEGQSDTDTRSMCPSLESAMEVPSTSDTHLAELSGAESKNEADLSLGPAPATAPSGSRSDGAREGCCYTGLHPLRLLYILCRTHSESLLVSDQPTNPKPFRLAWRDPISGARAVLEPIECLTRQNSVQYRVQTDYWTERHLEQQRDRVTRPSRKVVIYSDETLREDVHLDIPLQIKHTTTNPVIPSSLADQPCTDLGVDGLLKNLNKILRTSYSANTPGLSSVLHECMRCEYDFGTAFGRLRRFWDGNFEGLPARLAGLEREDGEMRENALDREHGLITRGSTAPRRVWDTFSNRVLPIWALCHTLHWRYLVYPISHSWMAEESRDYVLTPINGFEWHVPLPKDTTLDRIRVELLNLGAEYVWLDVICLRQEDESKPEKEDTRKEEWMLDVPTIGYIYRESRQVVTYFEGLGRPFHISDISSPRHWINRAWTLQETSATTLIGGLTEKSPFPPNTEGLDANANQFYVEFTEMTRYFYNSRGLFSLIEIMLRRSASHEVDKVAGLAYLTVSGALPSYVRNEDDEAAQVEAAWTLLVHTMPGSVPMPLIFLYPAPGEGSYIWMPTWRQLKSAPSLPHATFDLRPQSYLHPNPHRLHMAYVLNLCTIQGLDEPNAQQRCRRGTLTIQVDSHESGPQVEQFVVTAHHQHPIPDDPFYVLVGLRINGSLQDLHYWMVGLLAEDAKQDPHSCMVRTYTPSRAIRKVSVLEMEREDDRKRLDDLGLAICTPDVLLQ
ncbi:hypothetical protein NM688_g8124 [Phlebia brevispora]|uniref:Uncharacterized protein n=1 Tax=Phlebia brevispora TaxID=194682 RepID=A0ACC1RX64_9APHY|nr:hypothetical protein NM688_g8124 [Phlebia brevispora]